MSKRPDLSVDIASIRMKNPVMVASGTFGYGPEYADLVDLNRLGAIVVKGISIKPWQGNMTDFTIRDGWFLKIFHSDPRTCQNH